MRHILNGVEVSPRNREEIGIISDFTGDPEQLKVSTESIVLPREGLNIIKNHIENVGLFEGIPYELQLEGGITLNYYIDLLDSLVITDTEAQVKIKERTSIDNFKERAEGTSFNLMLTNGTQFNTFDVPYIIIKPEIIEQLFTTSISVFLMSKTIAEQIRDLQEALAELSEAIGVDPGDAIATTIRVIARLIYIGVLLYLASTLVIRLVALIFPPLRNLKGIKVRDLLETACAYFGYTFESTILSEQIPNLTILPVPLKKDRPSIFEFIPAELVATNYNTGVPGSSDSTPTTWSLLEALENMFNARTKVFNGVVKLERRDYWENVTTANITPALTLQEDRLDSFSYNTGDVWKRYFITYNKDFSEIHTLDKIRDFLDAEFSTEPNGFINEDLVSIKGLNEVNIPFSLGSRKEKLNIVEEAVKDLVSLADNLVINFGGNSNLSATIDARKGALQVGGEYWATTKILNTIDGRQTPDYLDKLSASSLWANYHSINQIQENAYLIKESSRVRLKASEFTDLLDNNFVDINGVICEILRLEWYDERAYCSITYKVPNDYPNGKVSTLVINL